MSLSKWSESMRNEWNEVNRVKWGEMSDLMDLMRSTLWESPYGQLRVSLSKWLDVSENQCPYQNDQNRWEMNEMKWIEWNEVKWVNGWKWLGTTLWEWSYGQLRVSLWKWLEWTLWESPYQNEWNRWEMNELKWIEVNRGKMSDLKDLMRSTLWKNPYGQLKVSLSKWFE